MTAKKMHKAVDPTAHVYCDESGNSGPNLLDDSQPVYVLGGWVVPKQYVAQAEQAVKALAHRLGVASGEIHGVKFLKTVKGQTAFHDFIRAMGKAGCLPVYNITEKRYWSAGKVVETYFDPFYNSVVPWKFYNNFLGKQELANDISHLPDEYLHEFAAAYRRHDADALGRCALRYATLFELKGGYQLAAWFRSSIPGLSKLAEDERAVNATLPARALGTVNVPVLASFLSLLESLARHYYMQPVHIFHDESKEFGHAYEWAFNIYNGAKRGVELHLPTGRMIVFSFDCVKSLNMVNSNECLLVQAADLLVSGLARYAKCIASGQEPPHWLAEAMEVIIPAAVLPAYFDMGTTAQLMGSPAFLKNMFLQLPSWRERDNPTSDRTSD